MHGHWSGLLALAFESIFFTGVININYEKNTKVQFCPKPSAYLIDGLMFVNHEFETLLYWVRIVKSWEKQSRLKYDLIYKF